VLAEQLTKAQESFCELRSLTVSKIRAFLETIIEHGIQMGEDRDQPTVADEFTEKNKVLKYLFMCIFFL
jgi:hypothetical protein